MFKNRGCCAVHASPIIFGRLTFGWGLDCQQKVSTWLMLTRLAFLLHNGTSGAYFTALHGARVW